MATKKQSSSESSTGLSKSSSRKASSRSSTTGKATTKTASKTKAKKPAAKKAAPKKTAKKAPAKKIAITHFSDSTPDEPESVGIPAEMLDQTLKVKNPEGESEPKAETPEPEPANDKPEKIKEITEEPNEEEVSSIPVVEDESDDSAEEGVEAQSDEDHSEDQEDEGPEEITPEMEEEELEETLEPEEDEMLDFFDGDGEDEQASADEEISDEPRQEAVAEEPETIEESDDQEAGEDQSSSEQEVPVDEPMEENLENEADSDLDDAIDDIENSGDEVETDFSPSKSKPSEESTENKTVESDDSFDDLDEMQIDKTMSVGDINDRSEELRKAYEANPAVDEAVDDIVRTESDESIKEADFKVAALEQKKNKKTLKMRIGGFFAAWWGNKGARYGTIFGLLALLTALALLPASRYMILNTVGVRVSSSMTVIDKMTRLPLSNVTVTIQDQSVTTTESGDASFTGLKLGDSQLKIEKRGFAINEREIVLGWGSNPIGEQELDATGEQFSFRLVDWQSGEAVLNATATAGESSALSNEQGEITLVIGAEDLSLIEISVDADGYRTEIFAAVDLSDEVTEVMMVPEKKNVFISNRDDSYDLYSIDIDGQNEQLLIDATGNEREVPDVLTHPTDNKAAFVSSRDGIQNSGGFILEGLYIVDAISGESEQISRSEQVQLVGWSGETIVFWEVVEGTSAGNPERSKVYSYNTRTQEEIELAAANYFNQVELIGNTVYYAVSGFAVPQSQARMFSIKVDGTAKTQITEEQVWTLYRNVYDSLFIYSSSDKWYELAVGSTDAVEVAQPANPRNYEFVDSPSGGSTAWVVIRDGQGVLLQSNTTNNEEQEIITQSGLSSVLYWANEETIVYRVINSNETADYLINLVSGEPVKIVDVTASQNRGF